MLDKGARSVRRADDAGLGIVEALMAILLFGLLAVAMVPAIIIGLQVSAASTTVTAANQVVQGRLEQARTVAPDCGQFNSFLLSNSVAIIKEDGRGARFEVVQNAVLSDGSTVNGSSTSWCEPPNTVAAVTLSVTATALDTETADVANVSTVIAVPGYGRTP